MRDSGHVVVCTCVKRRLNAQEEMLALSGTQRYLGGPLCADKLQKIVLWFAQAKLPDNLLRLHIPGMVSFVCDQE